VDPVTAAALSSWHLDAWLLLMLAATAIVYLRGWRVLRLQIPDRFPVWRAAAFVCGLVTLFVALASPLDAFSGFLLSAHMTQHLLLMMIAPPLLLLGCPSAPLLRGLPTRIVKPVLGPFLAWPALRRLGQRLTRPATAWVVFVAATWIWHLPAPYARALYSPYWHWTEHACFFVTALLFWWPVVLPWPSRATWPTAAIVVYLLLADLQNTALSAIFAFSERVIYPAYAAVPRLWNLSVLDDQIAAGAIMWVPGSIVFLLPVAILVMRMLESPHATPRVRPSDVAAVVLACTLLVAPGIAMADGGKVRLNETAGPFRISVFTLPSPLRTHAVDISVMVQPLDDWRPLLDAHVELELERVDRAADDVSDGSVVEPVAEHTVAARAGATIRVDATREEAHNKLLYAAHFHVPEAGIWNLRTRVRHGEDRATVTSDLEIHPTPWWMHMPGSGLLLALALAGLVSINLRLGRIAPGAQQT